MLEVMQQFKKFCLIGGLGFIVDSLCFLFFTALMSDVMLARILSFWLAASTTWFGNRVYTYRHLQSNDFFYQWVKHIMTAHLSGSLNLLVFWSTVDIISMPLAFCLGILAGLLSNYFIINRFVFVN